MYRIVTGKDDVPHNTLFQKIFELGNNEVSTRTATGYMNALPQASLSQKSETISSLKK